MPPPSHPAPAAGSAAELFLRRAYRRARIGLLLWSLALAALALVATLADRLGWLPSLPYSLASLLPALAALVVLMIWIRRARRLSPAALAHRLDAEWGLAARLESSAELSADRSAIAAAQRADAATRLGRRPPPAGSSWSASLGLLVLALILLLGEVATLGYRRVTAPPALDPALSTAAAPAPDLSAALLWRTPKSEIKATAIEEIPLAATASTRTGLRSVSLEIAVNGEPRLSRPLDPAALAALATPGEHAVELSLYLDEVGAQEFDLVSYHLRAERATPSPTPAVTSPLQFVQIRPPREDVARRRASGSGASLDVLATLAGNLKTAQLQLLKQNFLLAHAPLDHALPAWREENTRVAADQRLLAEKAAEARDYAVAEALPAIAVDNLGRCIPQMNDAAALIADAANEPAALPQGRALALLVGIEKALRKVIIESDPGVARSDPPPPKNHDPFKDGQQFELPPRPATPAGELEQLAQAQAEAAQPDPAAPEKKDPLAEQAELARRLAALAGSRTLDPAAQAKAEQAARDAAEAARQLEQKDADAARAPAEASAQALREAVAAQEATGLATARAQLETLRREINAAERLVDPEARAAALAEAAARLRAEALAQQQTGSTEAARQLAAAADKIEASSRDPMPQPEAPAPGKAPAPPAASSSPPPDSPSSPPPSDQAATPPPPPSPNEGDTAPSACTNPGSGPGGASSQAAARAQAALTPRDQALARAARQLQPSPRPGQGAGGAVTDPANEIELGAQLAAELLPALDAQELARLAVGKARADRRPDSARVVVPEDLRDVADRLVVLLEAARLAGRRDEEVRRFNPDDLDPAYRPAVETYFEKLSREAAK